ncbi:M48 family peptidase [Paludibacter sp. 221]|uniref:M48 family metallopeptidase n=1 Tax=Paludibacter sp. 221 TaxID=2302939 RepID=UPI0013D1BF8C|nr:SprT family zinc-dependent metalloprotease [Paludibacter sp. 221]NDV46411.1 M48 family peptidase [Paludibacter sp. 221]
MPSRFDPDFGIIEFNYSKRAKNINVRILKDKLVVSLPPNSSEEKALQFINSVRPRILKKQEKVKDNEQKAQTLLTDESGLQTLTFSVKLKSAERTNIFISLQQGVLTIEYPQGTDVADEAIQSKFWEGIKYFLKKEAKRVLPGRTKYLADKYGFSFSSVKIQSSKSRWGSCSQGENINLSFYLMLLPQHLVDYVILHELCHTREMNHSPKFWQWMDKVTDGQSKKLRAEVKSFHIPR